jgi:hypothetical protein
MSNEPAQFWFISQFKDVVVNESEALNATPTCSEISDVKFRVEFVEIVYLYRSVIAKSEVSLPTNKKYSESADHTAGDFFPGSSRKLSACGNPVKIGRNSPSFKL